MTKRYVHIGGVFDEWYDCWNEPFVNQDKLCEFVVAKIKEGKSPTEALCRLFISNGTQGHSCYEFLASGLFTSLDNFFIEAYKLDCAVHELDEIYKTNKFDPVRVEAIAKILSWDTSITPRAMFSQMVQEYIL